MDKTNFVSAEPLGLGERMREPVRESERQFTPRQFFAEAGAVIASCLALGLLAQVLEIMVGYH